MIFLSQNVKISVEYLRKIQDGVFGIRGTVTGYCGSAHFFKLGGVFLLANIQIQN